MAIQVPVSCNRDCTAGCPLIAEVEGNRVVRIFDSPERSRYGRGCARGYNSQAVLDHPDRIVQPHVRVRPRGRAGASSADFAPVSWDEALDTVAERLRDAHDRGGPRSIMRIGGSGACRGVVHHTARLTQRFLSMAGGFTETTGSYSAQAVSFTMPLLYGTRYAGIDVKTLHSSRLVLLWGFNPADTRFGTETGEVLAAVRGSGTPIVVLDPRRSATVRRYATRWIPLLPGSDTVLMLALLHEIFRTGSEDRAAIDELSVGFGQLEAYLHDNTPEWAEPLCGVAAEDIRWLTVQLIAHQPAALLAGLAIQRTLGGEDAVRLAGALQVALGNVGIPGGSTGAGQWFKLPPPRIANVPVPPNPEQSSVPVYEWASAILNVRNTPNRFRVAYNVGGNYAVQGSDIAANRAALESLDLVVTHDLFLTDTALLSDVVLPVTSFLERRDVLLTADNYLLYSERAAEPPDGVRDDYWIFSQLAARLGFQGVFTGGRTADQWVEACIADSEIPNRDAFVRSGVYEGTDQARVGLSEFVSDPTHSPLATPSGKIEIASVRFAAVGGTPTPIAHVPERPLDYPLAMVTPHDRMRTNSQFDNVEPMARGIDRTLWIHPTDAAARGIGAGTTVRITSPRGVFTAPARVTDGIMRGVVSINQGAWGDASPNHVTSTVPTMPSHGSRTHSTWVEVAVVVSNE